MRRFLIEEGRVKVGLMTADEVYALPPDGDCWAI
jgi:hypothetical protein